MVMGMVGEACLPNKAYFSWTPDYIPFFVGLMSVLCLNIPSFEFVPIDFMIYQKSYFDHLP